MAKLEYKKRREEKIRREVSESRMADSPAMFGDDDDDDEEKDDDEEDDDGDHLAVRMSVSRSRRWPSPEGDLEEEDRLAMPGGCTDCSGSSDYSPQRGWEAFYRDWNNLRDSRCIAGGCKWAGWDTVKQRHFVERRSGDVDRQAEEDGVEVKKNEEAGQDLYKNSQECPSLPADQSDSPPPCLQPGWGSLLPPA